MDAKKLTHMDRRLTDEERARHERIREAIAQEIPPMPGAHPMPAPPGIPSRIRAARETQGLTWYALAKLAGLSDQAAIRDIEQGKDVKVSDLESVAAALGLKLELVEQSV
jgi:DNA-binding XRE family transcriptional regulator